MNEATCPDIDRVAWPVWALFGNSISLERSDEIKSVLIFNVSGLSRRAKKAVAARARMSTQM
jgi:hypothetical protein